GTGMLCLQGIAGDMIVCSWLYPRAAHWVLERNGIHGQIGTTLLKGESDEGEEEEDDDDTEKSSPSNVDADRESNGNGKTHVGLRHSSNRTVYCLDLRTHPAADL